MAGRLTDDGTLDTVISCPECGDKMRFNFDPDPDYDNLSDAMQKRNYDAWVVDCIDTFDAEHECPEDDEDEDDEDEEDEDYD